MKPLFEWYQHGIYGPELVIGLKTRPCSWGRCKFCSLSSEQTSTDITYEDVIRQASTAITSHIETVGTQLSKVSLYSGSSMFDDEILTDYGIMQVVKMVANRLKPKIISIESRPEHVEEREIYNVMKLCGPDIELEIAYGMEVFDYKVRQEELDKGLQWGDIHTLYSLLKPYNATSSNARVKTYAIFGVTKSMTGQRGVLDILRMRKYLSQIQHEYNVPTLLHINTMYLSDNDYGRQLRDEEWQPPDFSMLNHLVSPIDDMIGDLAYYLGVDDEGLALPGMSMKMTPNQKEAIKSFNFTQNPNVLLNPMKPV